MSADRLTATVVGGGVAGLASAVALAQAGWRVTVLERAPVIVPETLRAGGTSLVPFLAGRTLDWRLVS